MDKHSPTPWRLAHGDNPPDFSRTVDARGCFVFGDNSGPKKADAAYIVEAVNERDRLRDMVRRLAESLDVAADALWQANIDGRMAITQPEPRSRHLHGVDIDALLREAREALEEDKP